MNTNIATLSLNVVRKMADAAEVEARKLGADIGIAVVASDSSVFFSRSMDKVDAVCAREAMKRVMDALQNSKVSNVTFIANSAGTLGALAVDGADFDVNQKCVQAALNAIEA